MTFKKRTHKTRSETSTNFCLPSLLAGAAAATNVGLVAGLLLFVIVVVAVVLVVFMGFVAWRNVAERAHLLN